MLMISPIPAFSDNYIWAIHNHRGCVVVDPGDASPVLNYIEQNQLNLEAILCTHHHRDHVGGIDRLCQNFPVPVYGPTREAKDIVNTPLREGDTLHLLDSMLGLTVLDIPGHTLGHIAFYNDDWLFCGDTLFAGGCGRLFEGTALQLFNSLQKLAALPEQTLVFCAHEYTFENLTFARIVEPSNPLLRSRYKQVEMMHSANAITLPSSIALEKNTNPFLRCRVPEIIRNVQNNSAVFQEDPVIIFSNLRKWRDDF